MSKMTDIYISLFLQALFFDIFLSLRILAIISPIITKSPYKNIYSIIYKEMQNVHNCNNNVTKISKFDKICIIICCKNISLW